MTEPERNVMVPERGTAGPEVDAAGSQRRPASEEPGPSQTPARPAWVGACAGVVAAGAALAAAELPTALAGERTGAVTAVGNEFIDRFAGSLKDLAVELFGQNDKVALVTGIVVISLALGAALGVTALRSLGRAAAGFVLFGMLGLWAQAVDPDVGLTLAVVSAVLGVVAGVATLALLLSPRVVAPAGGPARGSGWSRGLDPREDPTVKTPDRRSFLLAAGAVGATAAVVGLGGRALRGRSSIEAQRQALVLPGPERATPVPDRGLLDTPGVSPYITPNDDFYKIDTALVTPQVNAESWRLRVTGLVDAPYELTFDELVAMDLVEEPVTLACVSNEVGGDLVGNASWLGVPLATVLERAAVRPEASQVVGRATDGFTVGFPTEVGLDGRVALVAVGMNGEPLPAAHGYPARLVVAGLYGYVSATKWLTEIELTRLEDFDAYWVPRGWAKEAPVKTQSRIDVPRGGDVPAGPVAVGGVAWAPATGVSRVEVRVDDGPWQAAQLGTAASGDTWVQWVYRWEAEPGEHTLRCRAIDATGEVQTAEESAPAPDGATGHHAVTVTVTS
ncbi:MAG TPA: molybdopterin-dependent oxidoreductase [Acidimicrobiales bacterium]